MFKPVSIQEQGQNSILTSMLMFKMKEDFMNTKSCSILQVQSNVTV